MSELKSVAVWHPDETVFTRWYDWFSSRGWMVIDVGDSVEEVPEVGIWVIAWNEQFHRPKLRTEFEIRRRKFPTEVWCASVARARFEDVSLDELSLFGLDDIFSDDPQEDDFVDERLDLALRNALLPASRHRVRSATHIGTKSNLVESISTLTGQLMRETDLNSLTFWLNSLSHGMRAWVRRSQDRIESLAGTLQMSDWTVEPSDKWGIPRRAKAHRWELQTKDEMAWWVPLAYRHRVIGYLELVFPSSLSADIEMGTLRAREWIPALISTLQEHSTLPKNASEVGHSPSNLAIAQILVDCARRAQRPLSTILLRTSELRERWIPNLSLRTSDVVVERSANETLLVLPETDLLSALTFLTRISDVWLPFDHVGISTLHQHGISLDELIRQATNQSLWETTSGRNSEWALYAEANYLQAMKHAERIFASAEASEDGKILMVVESLSSETLTALASGWEGIVVGTEISGELPIGWSWVKAASAPANIEIFVIASNGTYGFKGPAAEPNEPHSWMHTSDPRLVLQRWSQLTTEYLLGGER